ncbi:MAG TPA: hypothetical protein PKE29_15035 [Phycisphaerales bacterium]|nr:hypothetical protein [Phycisphaerales bacterium]
MKLASLLTCAAALSAGALSVSASAAVYIPGAFNGWTDTTLMTESPPASGVFTYSATGLAANSFQQFVLAADPGYANKYIPSGDQWLTANGSGDLTVGFSTNTISDGWSPAANRVSTSNPESAWTAVGDWQGWNNANPATAMSLLSGNIYSYSTTLAPGSYQYKAVATGSWNAIGSDSRSVNANTLGFTTDAVLNQVQFLVDAGAGTIRVNVTPTPGAAGLLGLGGLLAARRRR